jgi:hypothetical protein
MFLRGVLVVFFFLSYPIHARMCSINTQISLLIHHLISHFFPFFLRQRRFKLEALAAVVSSQALVVELVQIHEDERESLTRQDAHEQFTQLYYGTYFFFRKVKISTGANVQRRADRKQEAACIREHVTPFLTSRSYPFFCSCCYDCPRSCAQ